MTALGFRATFSTLANESNLWHPDAIERALAHVESNQVRRAHEMGQAGGVFCVIGLKRDTYRNAKAIRQLIKSAFIAAGLPTFTPHAFRKTLVKWAERHYPTLECFKAFSQNIGHSNVVTTVSAYMPVSVERQGELIKSGPK
ncbi:hypothetical protein [Shimia ponticola]|uniref:hypothetical protein n=1 Tax=Shimia ponticola TaxID=2582893 RepID=UPI002103FD41|nr:hypothetical protein [Shimia ponticola]